CRRCDDCGHAGINDSAPGRAACRECEWGGDAPSADQCPSCENNGCLTSACPRCGGLYEFVADADIALKAASVPDGWKLVPIEPTDEMLLAEDLAWPPEDDESAFAYGKAMWAAFLAAAPQQP